MNFLKTSQCQSTYNFSMTSQCQITYNTHESFDDCIIYIINVMLIILIVYLFSNVNISDKQLRCLKCSLGYELAWLVRDQSSWKALIISREDFNIAAPILFRPFRPRCQWVNLTLAEFQCLISSIFKHNCVWAYSRPCETVWERSRAKIIDEVKITLYTIIFYKTWPSIHLKHCD